MITLGSASTSALGTMCAAPVAQVLLVGCLSVTGTSAAVALQPPLQQNIRSIEQTSACASLTVEKRAAAIGELRRLTGLTWDQLARLLGVSRRTLHFWASGKAMLPANEEHIQRVLSVMRQMDRGTASLNRKVLLEAASRGVLAFDLLAHRRYSDAAIVLGRGSGNRVSVPPLSPEAIAARRPMPPQQFVEAPEAFVHTQTGARRVAKTVRRRVAG
jgi:DNA-binding transcriptional regulator YiaG